MRSAVICAVALSTAGCDIRHALVRMFTPEYEPPIARELKASFEGADAGRPRVPIVLRKVAGGFIQPTDVQFVPGQPDLMLVLEKTGKLYWVELAEGGDRGVLLELDVLDVSEQGLLGLAFHPDFEKNGRFYLNANIAHGGDEITRVSEWTAAPGADLRRAKPKMTRTILDVVQPYQNHNAGQLAFGPDRRLYVGFGDGGWRNDPHGHGQNPKTMLGSMLRIDVDQTGGDKPYAIPNDNPFAADDRYLPEIWAIGLRNPWRYSFAPDGRLIAGDVGQDAWEEITFVPRGGNLGWNLREGAHCFNPPEGCKSEGLVEPIHEYGREEGGSVTGGFVALAESFEALRGKYVFGDFLSGAMWALDLPAADGTGAKVYALGKWPLLISTFGRDEKGRVYVADYPRGNIYRIDPEPKESS